MGGEGDSRKDNSKGAQSTVENWRVTEHVKAAGITQDEREHVHATVAAEETHHTNQNEITNAKFLYCDMKSFVNIMNKHYLNAKTGQALN